MAPWLNDFVLQKLAPPSATTPNNDGQLSAASSSLNRNRPSPVIPRLIQIMARGGDWWTNPLDRNNKEAWVILSDSKWSIKATLTPAAMQRILEEEEPRHSASTASYRFFNYSRGRCALIRDYTVRIHKQQPWNGTTTTAIVLSVGSMEAKPGFHLPSDGTNRNNGLPQIQQAVEDDINVRYAMQAWNERNEEAQQQQQQQRQQGNSRRESRGGGREGNHGMNAGSPHKRQRTVPLGDVMTTVVGNPDAYETILRLAEEQENQESLDDENDNGGAFEESQDTTKTSSQGSGNPESQPLLETQPSYPQDSPNNSPQQEQGPPTPDSQSRMYIQNVLLSEEDEEEAEGVAEAEPPRTPNRFLPLTGHTNVNASARDIGKSTWERVKQQLSNPNCQFIVFQSEDNEEEMPLRPLATPAVTSGAYLCRYGLARWMQHNIKRQSSTPHA